MDYVESNEDEFNEITRDEQNQTYFNYWNLFLILLKLLMIELNRPLVWVTYILRK